MATNDRSKLVPEMKQLGKDGIIKRAIAKQLGVSRTSVIRLLRSKSRKDDQGFSLILLGATGVKTL